MTSTIPVFAKISLPILGSFAGGSLYGWSGYAPAVRAIFDASHSATAMIFSLALVSFTVGVLVGPRLFSQVPVRIRLAGLSAAAAICLLLSGFSPTLGLFLLSYGLGFGFLSGALYNHAIARMSQTHRPELLVPICVAAFGLGGAAFGAASVWLTQIGFGVWSSAPVLVCLIAVASGAIAVGEEDVHVCETTEKGHISAPTGDIVVLWVVFAVGSLPGLIVLGMAADFVPRDAGFEVLAAFAVVLAAVGNTVGRLTASVVAPRYGAALGVVFAMILSALSLLVLMVASEPSGVLVALLLVALAYGHLAANMPLLVKSRVNAREFPTAFGWVFTGWGIAGLLGPWSAGWLFDRTGEFTIALSICVALVLVGLGLVCRAFVRVAPR